ncbi:MAG: fibrobacter succinogenes major paralogous domain-containing protein [Fibromonadaceae bacterium]|jgi:uncharacterized protein (TIGR02145 family)|nr:fibrobacter succinogenes major paralogous domain-containing protein [Fibromonadaceae bacterium]
MKKAIILLVLLGAIVLLALFGTEIFMQKNDIFIDSRDEKKYRIVKIGTQTWMAENLNHNASGSKCYDNKPENCDKYGRLYDWGTAKNVCPNGWHLPSNDEWDVLYHYVDGTSGTESPYESETAGKYLKSKNDWKDYEGRPGNGEDKFGFSALPGGSGYSYGVYYDIGYDGYWWSANEHTNYNAYSRRIYYYNDHAIWYYGDRNFLHSVRCIKN